MIADAMHQVHTALPRSPKVPLLSFRLPHITAAEIRGSQYAVAENSVAKQTPSLAGEDLIQKPGLSSNLRHCIRDRDMNIQGRSDIRMSRYWSASIAERTSVGEGKSVSVREDRGRLLIH